MKRSVHPRPEVSRSQKVAINAITKACGMLHRSHDERARALSLAIETLITAYLFGDPSAKETRQFPAVMTVAPQIECEIRDIFECLQEAGTGLRAEQVCESLDWQSSDLVTPLAEALSRGRITKTGEGRKATYHHVPKK